MKTILSVLFCGLLSICQAQNFEKLSYSQLDSILEIYYKKGDLASCIPYAQAAINKAKAEHGEKDSIYAVYSCNLGYCYNTIGQFQRSLSLFLNAKTAYAAALGTAHKDYATNLNNIAMTYQYMGKYPDALVTLTEAKELSEKANNTETKAYALCINNMGTLHREMGKYESALLFYLQAQRIRTKILPSDHPDHATTLNDLAALHRLMGNLNAALPLYIQAKDKFEKTVGKAHPFFATALNNLAITYRDLKLYAEALPFFVQSIEVEKSIRGAGHPNIALSLNNLASLYKEMGSYQEAIPLFGEAKAIQEVSLGTEHPNLAVTLNNLVELHYLMKDYDKAWAYTKEALKVGSGLSLSANVNKNWADSLVNIEYKSNKHIQETINSLAHIYLLLGVMNKREPQIAVADLSAKLLQKQRNSYTTDDEKLRMLAKSGDWLVRSLMVFDKEKDVQKAFDLAEQNKAVLLLESSKAEKAYQMGALPDSLLQEEKSLIKDKDKLQAKIYEKRPQQEKDSLLGLMNATYQKIEKFKQKIEKEHPRYAQIKSNRPEAKIADIQALLNEKTALLEYVAADSLVYVFYIDKKQILLFEEKIGKNILKKQIATMHKSLSDYSFIKNDAQQAYQNYTETAYWFYQNILEKALQKAVGIEHLIIIPDGELGHLPFETFLRQPADGSGSYTNLPYLINDFKISYNYSATLWKENLMAVANKNNGLLLGMAANYNNPIDSQPLQPSVYRNMRNALLPLPSARRELEMLSQNFAGYFAFDSLASERAFKEKASEYGIIHLAMHGLLDKKNPILSSLAFTEDGDSLENNFLQAYEISQMRLNADLVVLSACETGYGKFEKGNGTASLARAFMYAGVPAMVVSLWEVNDASTAQIMQVFYQHLAAGKTKDEALRQAKLDYIQNAKGTAAHPAYWSAFVQMGDSRAIEMKVGGGAWKWWAVGGGVALLLVLFLSIRFKKK